MANIPRPGWGVCIGGARRWCVHTHGALFTIALSTLAVLSLVIQSSLLLLFFREWNEVSYSAFLLPKSPLLLLLLFLLLCCHCRK